MTDPILIVGTGQAGIKAAETLRAKGYADPITMVGEEPWLPYQRPPLSKAFLTGKFDQGRLYLKTSKWLDDVAINVMTQTRAVDLDAGEQRLVLADGTTLAYSQLLLATGTRARMLPLPGAQLAGVHTLRSMDDSKTIAAQLEAASSIVIVGGGFIGMEVAGAVRAMTSDTPKSVTVVEAQDRVLKRSVAPVMSDFLHGLHTGNGVTILTHTGVTALTGETGQVTGVELDDGSTLPADLVLISAGAQPCVELAEKAGLAIDRGICVDAACRTSAPTIFAAGDCTVFPSQRYGRSIALESVQNACDQAKHAAAAMLGEVSDYDPVPWFWSDQYDVKLQIAGLSTGFDRTETVGDPSEGRFSVHYFAGPHLLAVDSINDPRSHMMARRDIAAQPSAFAA